MLSPRTAEDLQSNAKLVGYLIAAGLILSGFGAILVFVLRARFPLAATILGVLLVTASFGLRALAIRRAQSRSELYLAPFVAAVPFGLLLTISLAVTLWTGKNLLGSVIPGGLTAACAVSFVAVAMAAAYADRTPPR